MADLLDQPYLADGDLVALRPDLDVLTAEVERARLLAEFADIAERARGVAFVPRAATWVQRRAVGVLELPHLQVREITSLVVGGSVRTVDADDLDGARGRLHLAALCGRVEVAYTHGLDAPPECILDAAAEYVERKARSDRSGVSRDVLSQAFDGGTTRYGTPDWPAGRYTGFNEVDRLINSARDYRVHIR